MTSQQILISIVFVPVIGAFVLPLLGRISSVLRNIAALLFVLISLAGTLAIAGQVFGGNPVTVIWDIPLGFNFVLAADKLAVFMAAVSSFISAIIVLYSFDYISHYEHQDEYYLMVVLFLGSMMGLVFSGSLILLYVFWEITSITSWRLIGFFRERRFVIKADKAFLITAFGALLMLIGFIIIYTQTGSFDLSAIKSIYRPDGLFTAAFILILAGILSKSATLPFQTWLPDAGVAPSPVTALLHAAILVKIGVYVFARLFVVTMPALPSLNEAVMIIAGASAVVAAGAALIDTDIKRIIAYSTISQIGFIFLGLASGSPIGIAGGILYILMHGLAKAGLFLCAGIVEQNTGEKDITRLGGLIKTMPVTAVAFLFCSFSVMGIPPFGGFFCKYMVITGAIYSGHTMIALVFIGGAFMTLLYLFRLFNLVFLGEQKITGTNEKSRTMVFSVALLAFLSLLGGIFIWSVNDVVVKIVGS